MNTSRFAVARSGLLRERHSSQQDTEQSGPGWPALASRSRQKEVGAPTASSVQLFRSVKSAIVVRCRSLDS